MLEISLANDLGTLSSLELLAPLVCLDLSELTSLGLGGVNEVSLLSANGFLKPFLPGGVALLEIAGFLAGGGKLVEFLEFFFGFLTD